MATRKTKEPTKARPKGRRTMEGWRAQAVHLALDSADFELLDNVLTVVPTLRIVAAIGLEARRRGLTYPVSAVSELQARLEGDELELGGHRIDSRAIAHAMPDGWFPIAHEGELLSRVYLALLRCEMESTQLAPHPVFHPE